MTTGSSDDRRGAATRGERATSPTRTGSLRHGRKRLGPRRAGYRRSAPVPPTRRTRQDDHNEPAAPRCSQTLPSPLVRPPELPLLSLRIARFGGHRNTVVRPRTVTILRLSLRIARFGGHRNVATSALTPPSSGTSLRIARFGGHRNGREPELTSDVLGVATHSPLRRA